MFKWNITEEFEKEYEEHRSSYNIVKMKMGSSVIAINVSDLEFLLSVYLIFGGFGNLLFSF